MLSFLKKKRRTRAEALAWVQTRLDPNGAAAVARLIESKGVNETAEHLRAQCRAMLKLRPAKDAPRTITKDELKQLIKDLEEDA